MQALRTSRNWSEPLPTSLEEIQSVELFKNGANITILHPEALGDDREAYWHRVIEFDDTTLGVEKSELNDGKVRVRLQGTFFDPKEGSELLTISRIPQEALMNGFIEDLYHYFTPIDGDVEDTKTKLFFRRWTALTDSKKVVPYLQAIVAKDHVATFKKEWSDVLKNGQWIETPKLSYQTRVWGSKELMLSSTERELEGYGKPLYTTSNFLIRNIRHGVTLEDIQRAHDQVPLIDDRNVFGAYNLTLLDSFSGKDQVLRVSVPRKAHPQREEIVARLNSDIWKSLSSEYGQLLFGGGNESPNYVMEQSEVRHGMHVGREWHVEYGKIAWNKTSGEGQMRQSSSFTYRDVAAGSQRAQYPRSEARGGSSGDSTALDSIERRLQALEEHVKTQTSRQDSAEEQLNDYMQETVRISRRQSEMRGEIKEIRETHKDTHSVLEGIQASIAALTGQIANLASNMGAAQSQRKATGKARAPMPQTRSAGERGGTSSTKARDSSTRTSKSGEGYEIDSDGFMTVGRNSKPKRAGKHNGSDPSGSDRSLEGSDLKRTKAGGENGAAAMGGDQEDVFPDGTRMEEDRGGGLSTGGVDGPRRL